MDGSNDRKCHHRTFKDGGYRALSIMKLRFMQAAIPIIVAKTPEAPCVLVSDFWVGLLFDRVCVFRVPYPSYKFSVKKKPAGLWSIQITLLKSRINV